MTDTTTTNNTETLRTTGLLELLGLTVHHAVARGQHVVALVADTHETFTVSTTADALVGALIRLQEAQDAVDAGDFDAVACWYSAECEGGALSEPTRGASRTLALACRAAGVDAEPTVGRYRGFWE